MALNLHDRILVFLILALSQAPVLKVLDIQAFEIFVAFSLPYLIIRTRGAFAKDVLLLFSPVIAYFFFSAFYTYFTQNFYVPTGVNPLKQPLLLSLVRIAQFSLIFFAANYLYSVLDKPRAAIWAIKAFLSFAALIAALSLVSLLIAEATHFVFPLVYDTAVYAATSPFDYGKLRLRGLFNEGGPFGLFLITCFGLMAALREGGNRVGFRVPALIAIVFIGAQSKAGVVCLLVALLGKVLLRLNLRKLALLVALAVAIPVLFFSLQNSFLAGFVDYARDVKRLADQAVIADPEDQNLAFGRISAFLIGPRMVLDRPILGVGVGNYSLVRNNPIYRGPLPPVQGWDLPGLGLLTVLIEGGVIGLGVLIASYIVFYLRIRRWKISPGLRYLFWLPLLIQIFGVQFYFAYHWIFLILMAAYVRESKKTVAA